jgi:sulfoxide reductase catalytic subunit YedY
MLVSVPARWKMKDALATPESIYLDRRRLIARLTGTTVGASLALVAPHAFAQAGALPTPPAPPPKSIPTADLYPARRNPAFTLDRPLTPEAAAASHNIFDEFTDDYEEVAKLTAGFATRPWKIHVGGQVEKQFTIDVDELTRKLGVEERLYRFRCVTGWAMAVPWTGIALRKFVELAKPLSKARYLRMVTAARPDQMPGWYKTRRVFPYYEGLTIEEATNELALLATGIYGHPLPSQHGAPIRLIVPWKYGLKGIKSIVAFQFTEQRPGTFWNELSPKSYSFFSNVDPTEPGQAEETLLHSEETRKTLPFNGYGEWVAKLYA